MYLKQKTAYEIRISDWSSDVCSSDLHPVAQKLQRLIVRLAMAGMGEGVEEQVLIREAMVQRRFRPFQQCVQNVRPMRSQRIAEIQVQGFSHPADPSVEKNMIAARPTTFSSGPQPTPAPLPSGPTEIGRAPGTERVG